MFKTLRNTFIFAAVVASLGSPAQARQDILIGGGSLTGVYYQVALHTCNLINTRKSADYYCIGRPALGSVFNIQAVIRGLLDFGIAQSDTNYAAAKGEGPWAGSPATKLRSVMSLYPETVLLMARAEAKIKSVDDLKGKIVNIGNAGSGHRINAEDILRLHNIDIDKDIYAEGRQQVPASQALIDGQLDAFFYTAGNPSTAIKIPAETVHADLININSEAIKKLVAEKPYYVMSTIPANTYKGISHDTETYAVKATVVASSDLSEQAVYDYVKIIFENLEELKGYHPAFKIMNTKDMLEGLTAPLHRGAIRYYKERGLL